MTIVAAAAGLFVLDRARDGGLRRAVALAICTGLVIVAPPLGIAGFSLMGVRRLHRRFRDKRMEAEAAESDVVLLADLVALGLRAGLSLIQSIENASRGLAAGLQDEVEGVVRAAGRVGSAVALSRAGGRAERLYRIAARAATTGAPLADAVEAFAAERRHADHARAVESARRLPVRMLVPLALLILPGFVVLAVGPALLEALARLQM